MIYLVTTAQPPAGIPTWAAILIAVMAGSGGILLWNVYIRWRKGTQQDALEISKAAIEQANNAQSLFVQYRVELEAAKAQIAEYLNQLIEVNRMLGEANARISILDKELQNSRHERTELRDALREARREHEKLIRDRDNLIEQLAKLQADVTNIERKTP